MQKLTAFPYHQDRDKAFNSLVKLGDYSVKELASYLMDKERRELVSEVLEKIGSEESARVLINSAVSGDIYWQKVLNKRLSAIGKPAVLPLLHGLYTKNRNIQILSAEVLGKIQDKRSIEGLIKALDYADDRVMVSVIDSLGELRATESIEKLLNLLSGYSNEIQKTTIKRVLSEIGSPCVNEILKALTGTDITFKKCLIEILGNINDKRTISPLIEYLKSSDENFSTPAIEALGKKPEALAIIIEGLKDENSIFRKNCASVMSKLLSVDTVDILVKACRDKDEEVACNAIMALGAIGDKRAGQNLMELLKTKNYSHAKIVIEALYRMSDKAISPLIKSLSDRDSDVRDRASRALIKIGPKVIIPLIETLKNGDSLIKERVTYIFNELGPSAIPDLIKLLSEEDENLINFATDILISQSYRCNAPLWYLQKVILENPHWPVKKRAIKIISSTGVRYLETLFKFLNYREEPYRELACQAISDMGPSVIPQFLELCRNSKVDFPEYISKTFSYMGPSSISELLKYLQDEHDIVRRYTAGGITLMGPSAIKPLCRIIDTEKEPGNKQKLMMVLIELLRNYRPKDKKLTTSDVDSLRLGIELIRNYRKTCGRSLFSRFSVDWGKGAEKMLVDIMKESPKDIIIFMEDDDKPGEREIEIIDI